MQKILDLCYGNIPNTYIHVFRRKAKLVKINYKNKAEKKMNLWKCEGGIFKYQPVVVDCPDPTRLTGCPSSSSMSLSTSGWSVIWMRNVSVNTVVSLTSVFILSYCVTLTRIAILTLLIYLYWPLLYTVKSHNDNEKWIESINNKACVPGHVNFTKFTWYMICYCIKSRSEATLTTLRTEDLSLNKWVKPKYPCFPVHT